MRASDGRPDVELFVLGSVFGMGVGWLAAAIYLGASDYRRWKS